MEFKGTKGKWYKGVTSDVKQVGTKKVIADCCFFENDRVVEQANALLISKAPEMLEVLHKAILVFSNDEVRCGYSDLIEEMKLLISQATELK